MEEREGKRRVRKEEEGERGFGERGMKSSFADLPIESPNEFGAEAAGDA